MAACTPGGHFCRKNGTEEALQDTFRLWSFSDAYRQSGKEKLFQFFA